MTAPDPVRRRRLVDAARRTFGDAPLDTVIGADVHASWARCARDVAPQATAPVELADPRDVWEWSPMRRAAEGVLDDLAALATREDYVAAVTDAAGRIVWSSAGGSMLRRAERASFVRGANWSEPVAGTNAPGLVLRTGRPAAVFATEHWCDSVHDWVCYAAPVRDASGAVVGVLDLSSHWRRANPLALGYITSVARLIELELAHAPQQAGRGLHLCVLGAPRARQGGVEVHLSHRQVEILAILALHDGLTLPELHAKLYGDREVSTATLKAEVSHLRRVLDGAIGSRPYRLTVPVELDVVALLDAVRAGDLARAVEHYRGQLLPASESPYLADLRHHVDVVLLEALVRSHDLAALQHYATLHPWDERITERVLALCAPRQTLPTSMARMPSPMRKSPPPP